MDSCTINECIGGTTGFVACEQDCANLWGGNDILDQYYLDLGKENRENADSSMVDSLIYKTKKGRIVYGGGGITPDIHITDDTYISNSTQNILYSSQRIIFKYADSIKEKYIQLDNFNAFNSISQNNVLEPSDFFQWLNNKIETSDENKLEYDKDSLLLNWNFINNRIQSEIAANLWGKDYRYYMRLHIDKQFQTALNYFDLAKSFVE